MQARSILTGAALVLAALFILDVPAADAATQWTNPAGGFWDVAGNWNNGVPDPNDVATFPELEGAYTVTIRNASAVADSLSVHANCTIEITHASNATKLTLSGSSSTINGDIYLKKSNSTLAFTTSNHTLSGSGKIVGEHNSAQITVAAEADPGISLTSEITIEGALWIEGKAPTGMEDVDGTFVNNGLVHANRANETLTIYRGTIEGSCDGEFKVATSDAKLQFCSGVGDIEETNMGCTFTQSAGTFDIDVNIDTRGPCSGTFDLTHGTLDCCEGTPCDGCS
jgi:hypothetical protein